MKKILIKLINIYQSTNRSPKCNFIPTCSEYTKQALDKYGTVKGSALSFKRIMRCHPFKKQISYDPLD